jgi:hypothetical protein
VIDRNAWTGATRLVIDHLPPHVLRDPYAARALRDRELEAITDPALMAAQITADVENHRAMRRAAGEAEARQIYGAAFGDRELGAIVGAFEAADREGSIDDIGKALHAQLAEELDERLEGNG